MERVGGSVVAKAAFSVVMTTVVIVTTVVAMTKVVAMTTVEVRDVTLGNLNFHFAERQSLSRFYPVSIRKKRREI